MFLKKVASCMLDGQQEFLGYGRKPGLALGGL